MSEHKGVETQRGIFQIADSIFTCPREAANRFIFDLGDIYCSESPRFSHDHRIFWESTRVPPPIAWLFVHSPSHFGYMEDGWTVALLRAYLAQHHAAVRDATVRRQLKAGDGVSKRFAKTVPRPAPTAEKKSPGGSNCRRHHTSQAGSSPARPGATGRYPKVGVRPHRPKQEAGMEKPTRARRRKLETAKADLKPPRPQLWRAGRPPQGGV
jgi:hypothetical protein